MPEATYTFDFFGAGCLPFQKRLEHFQLFFVVDSQIFADSGKDAAWFVATACLAAFHSEHICGRPADVEYRAAKITMRAQPVRLGNQRFDRAGGDVFTLVKIYRAK